MGCINIRYVYMYWYFIYKDDNSKGGLHMPSQSFLTYIIKLEDAFVNNLSVYTKSRNVGHNLLKIPSFIKVHFESWQTFPRDFHLSKLFFRVGIYYTIAFTNKYRNSKCNMKCKKYICQSDTSLMMRQEQCTVCGIRG